MSPLTPDERAALAQMLHTGQVSGELDWRAALADKLEAEPDLMGRLADSLKIESHPYVVQERDKARTERDEAREALRDLLEASVGLDHPNPSESAFRRLMAARSATRAVLEGVACAPALGEEDRPS